MHVEFCAVLTRETLGTWEPEHQRAVQRLPGMGMAEQAQAGAASRGQVPGRREAPEGVAAGGAAGPDHRDAAAALPGAQREDGGPGPGDRGAAALARARPGTALPGWLLVLAGGPAHSAA